jgi:phage shock protein A
MATAKQIQYRIGQTKKKLAKLGKDVNTAKGKMKTLEGQLKKAKASEKPKAKKASPKKKGGRKR